LGTESILVYADYNLLVEDTHVAKKNKEIPLVASDGDKYEERRVKTKCMFMFYEQNAGKNHNVKTSYKSLKFNNFKICGHTPSKSNLH
jgi:hypothetical protein